jgi:chemotaxis signal transduction protein
MEGVARNQPEIAFAPVEVRQETGPAPKMWEKIEEMFDRIRASSEKVEGILSRMEETLLRLTEGAQKHEKEPLPVESPPVSITVFKANGKLFGVENDKIYKVFRVPETLYERYCRAGKIRLRDVEVRMIDLRKIFSMEEDDERGAERILLVKDDGQYKGFRIEEVLKKLSAPLLQKRHPYEGYSTGTIQWRYEDHPVEIPVLDLKKF